MKSKPIIAITLALVVLLVLSVSVLAMSSASYQLDWLVPLSGSGGGKSASAS